MTREGVHDADPLSGERGPAAVGYAPSKGVVPLGEESVVAIEGDELLVILDGDSPVAGGGGSLDRFRIVHAVSPTVFVIELPGDTSAAEVAAVPGVAAVSEGAVAPELVAGLDEAEALFVRAWARRLGVPGQPRPGEGLDWDARGFEPPDGPPGVESDGLEMSSTDDE
jgi:hypothetical protein